MYISSVLPSHTSVTVTNNLLFFLVLAVHDFRIGNCGHLFLCRNKTPDLVSYFVYFRSGASEIEAPAYNRGTVTVAQLSPA
jgi:hypothetical protein